MATHSVDKMIEKLRNLREDNIRDPEAVRDLWTKLDLIERKLGIEEKWTVIEQFCMAAIDLHDEGIYSSCLKRLNQQFPNSSRVRLLQIMALHELPGDYDEAVRCYNEMIEDDETNANARKRKIAILICQKRITEAIRELCDYLKIFMNDNDAWKELCELYMLEQDYSRAIFCMEELLMLHPLSHIYHTRMAEIYYTQGSHESMEQARSYYSQALKMNDTNVRAMHGLNLTLKNQLAGNKITAQQRRDYEKMLACVKTSINNIYDKSGNQNVSKYMKVV